MQSPQAKPDDEDIAPGEVETEQYRATTGRQGGPPEFLWFVTANSTERGEHILPIADIRLMEPPRDVRKEIAYIHFSTICVVMTGKHLRRVLHRISLRRCSAIYQYRHGQHRPPEGEPVVEDFKFIDLTKVAHGKDKDGAKH